MSFKRSAASLVFGLALGLPIAAQDEPPAKDPTPAESKPAPAETAPKTQPFEPPLHRWGGWTLSVAGWSPSLVGGDEEVAMSYSADASLETPAGVSGVARSIDQRSDARIKQIVDIAYHFPRSLGTVVAHYSAMNSDDAFQAFTPGQRDFLESRIYPFAAGAFDDGRADGFTSRAMKRTREFRLEYQKRAFESRWARGTWGVGFREVSHERALGIAYYTIVPNFPPSIPPVVDPTSLDAELRRLAPKPDSMTQQASYSGHGLGASLDVEFTLHPRISLITGLSVGLIRGTGSSAYSSATSYYYLQSSPSTPLTKSQLFAILENPCFAPAELRPDCYPGADNTPPSAQQPHFLSEIQVADVSVGASTSNRSQLGQSYDVYFGVKVNAYKGLSFFVTARDVSYVNVGSYVVPRKAVDSSQTPLGTEVTNLNAGYEGYTVGLSWRF